MIISVSYPFLGSYISGGVSILVAITFTTLSLCGYKRGLFLPFLSGLLALPEIFVVALSFYYHLMYNFYEFFYRKHFTIEFYVFTLSIGVWIMLSLISFVIFWKIFSNDLSFNQWKTHNSIVSKIIFVWVETLSLLNFRAINIFWSKFAIFPVLSTV